MTSVCVIIPFHKISDELQHCISSIRLLNPMPAEVIFVNDGIDIKINDEISFGNFTLIQNERTKGPSGARNHGAFNSSADILCFIDSDVEVPSTLIKMIVEEFQENPQLDAIFGSYDAEPGHQNFYSQYKNLFHHFVHQKSRRIASTFWTGCGAIKNSLFRQLDGFNENSAWVEDIEFGMRIVSSGYRVELIKDMQVKHWKRWSFINLIVSDIFHRAIPWTKFSLKFGGLPNDLNTNFSARISAIALILAISLLPLIPEIEFAETIALILMVMVVLLNAPLYKFFLTHRGPLFMFRSIVWHWIYLVYSSLAYLIGIILTLVESRKP